MSVRSCRLERLNEEDGAIEAFLPNKLLAADGALSFIRGQT